MHEVSLVRNIFRALEEEFGAERLEKLQTVRLKVGRLSNVEPVLMQNAFEAVVQDQPGWQAVALEMEMTPVLIECPVCGATTEVEQYRFRCGQCDTPTNQIISGTELLIHQVDFAD
jgi:hydrogenase nickel incorporation protein HypA/HybF